MRLDYARIQLLITCAVIFPAIAGGHWSPAGAQTGLEFPIEWEGIWTTVQSNSCDPELATTTTDTICAGDTLQKGLPWLHSALVGSGSFLMPEWGEITATGLSCSRSAWDMPQCGTGYIHTRTIAGELVGDIATLSLSVTSEEGCAGGEPCCWQIDGPAKWNKPPCVTTWTMERVTTEAPRCASVPHSTESWSALKAWYD